LCCAYVFELVGCVLSCCVLCCAYVFELVGCVLSCCVLCCAYVFELVGCVLSCVLCWAYVFELVGCVLSCYVLCCVSCSRMTAYGQTGHTTDNRWGVIQPWTQTHPLSTKFLLNRAASKLHVCTVRNQNNRDLLNLDTGSVTSCGGWLTPAHFTIHPVSKIKLNMSGHNMRETSLFSWGKIFGKLMWMELPSSL
jgi:hypothetical protein